MKEKKTSARNIRKNPEFQRKRRGMAKSISHSSGKEWRENNDRSRHDWGRLVPVGKESEVP